MNKLPALLNLLVHERGMTLNLLNNILEFTSQKRNISRGWILLFKWCLSFRAFSSVVRATDAAEKMISLRKSATLKDSERGRTRSTVHPRYEQIKSCDSSAATERLVVIKIDELAWEQGKEVMKKFTSIWALFTFNLIYLICRENVLTHIHNSCVNAFLMMRLWRRAFETRDSNKHLPLLRLTPRQQEKESA